MNQWLVMQGINSIPPPDHPLNTEYGKTQPVQVSCYDDATYYSGHQHSFQLQPLLWDHLGRPKLDTEAGLRDQPPQRYMGLLLASDSRILTQLLCLVGVFARD